MNLTGRVVVITGYWGGSLGGPSIHFCDPDRHLIEIATPGILSIY